MSKHGEKLRAIGLRLDGVTEGVACEGTVLEKRTLRVGKKAFLFIGANDALLKLGPSVAEARRMAAAGEGVRVGASGWVTLDWSAAPPPPIATLKAWIAESHALVGRGARTEEPAKKRPATKKAAKKTRRAQTTTR